MINKHNLLFLTLQKVKTKINRESGLKAIKASGRYYKFAAVYKYATMQKENDNETD